MWRISLVERHPACRRRQSRCGPHPKLAVRSSDGLSYRFSAINDPIAVVAFSRHSGATAIARLFYCATDIATSFWNAVYAETGEDCLCIWSKSESPEVGSVIAHIRNQIAHLRSIYVPRS